MMTLRCVSFIVFLAFFMVPVAVAYAGTMDAREIARINNCTPKKIDVVRQTLGVDGKTVYLVDCVIPKMKEDTQATSAPLADALMIECSGSLCIPLRRIVSSSSSSSTSQ